MRAPRSAKLHAVTSDLPLLLRATGMAVGLVFLLVVAARGGWRRRGDLIAVLACAVAYLACSAPARPCCAAPIALPLLAGAIAFPFAFWRLARIVLQDERGIPAGAWAGAALLLVGGIVAAAEFVPVPSSWRLPAAGLNKAAAFGFVLAALHALWRGWEGDLVEPRRRLRRVLVGIVGAYGLLVLVGELYLQGGRPPAWLDLLNVAAITLLLLATLLHFVQPREAVLAALFATESAVPTRVEGVRNAATDDDLLLRRLDAAMDAQQAWRDPDLSVATLARRAAMPEYVLRRLVHERLGHRNFATYVNAFRLREVEARLRDPALARRPILTLALEAGFGSIGPFNRAFRERHGMTPSAYRAAALGQGDEPRGDAAVDPGMP